MIEVVWTPSEDFTQIDLSVTNKDAHSIKIWSELGGLARFRGNSVYVTPAPTTNEFVLPLVTLKDLAGKEVDFGLGWKNSPRGAFEVAPGTTQTISLNLPAGLSKAAIGASKATFVLRYKDQTIEADAFYKTDAWKKRYRILRSPIDDNP